MQPHSSSHQAVKNEAPSYPPEQSEANQAFDIAQAMKMFYGNYDVKKQASVAMLPRDKGSLPAAGEEQMTIRLLFNAFSGDAGAQSFVMVTYAVPTIDETFDCHACAPIIGMAVFSQKGPQWTIDASNRAITFAGEWGNRQQTSNSCKSGQIATA